MALTYISYMTFRFRAARRSAAALLTVGLLATGSLATGLLATGLLATNAVAEAPLTAPKGLPEEMARVPGALLDRSPMPLALSLPSAAQAERMTYQTTGPHGPTPSTGVLYLPRGEAPAGGWPVVAWAHGTVGNSSFDAPSITGEHPATSDYVDSWLQQGYAVAATDYIGMGTPAIAPYLNCAAAAHAVIDSVRAAHEMSGALAGKWAVVGLSQGGHAAMCTANLADDYAPELDYRGAVANGAPSNIETLAPLGGPWFPPAGIFSGLTNFMAFTIAGLRDSRPDVDVDSFLTPLGIDLVDAAPRLPYPEFAKLSAGHSVAEMLSRSLNEPPLMSALHDYLSIPLTGYTRPIMIVQGAADTVVPIPLTLKLIADLNLAGTHPDFRVVPGDHLETSMEGQPAAAEFVARAFH